MDGEEFENVQLDITPRVHCEHSMHHEKWKDMEWFAQLQKAEKGISDYDRMEQELLDKKGDAYSSWFLFFANREEFFQADICLMPENHVIKKM